MKFTRILLLLALPVYLFSCKPQQKLPYYLENVTDSAGKGDVKIPELRIQKNDQLAIQIFSLSTEPKADEIYNQPSVGVAGQGSEGAGYFVDLNGNIKHHRLGVIHAEGLTKQELAAEIKKRLTVPVELLKEPTVIIRFLNFTITVLGQVGREGPIKVPGERVTILEAVGLAGGVTDYGKKNNLRIVREQDGKREIGFIDLSSKEIFESPYYHLVQNDVLIVEPTKQKMKDEDQARAASKISFAFTLVTVAATLANIFIK
ncbi:MAG: polysaccharide biosynthesis/export family protein [Chitinophagaceae bacterium]|nr:polysaccharide biosynthesis/export family protein [Chitinophagaceae bacterium]